MNSSIASANNATLSSVAATYALCVEDRGGPTGHRPGRSANRGRRRSESRDCAPVLPDPNGLPGRTGPAGRPPRRTRRGDPRPPDRRALRHGRRPQQPAGTLQSAIDGILAEIATLGGATNLVNAPAWLGNVTWDLLAGTNQIRNLHATGPLSIQLANDDWTLSFGCDAYTTQQTDDAIAAALTNYFTRAEVTATIVAAIDESKGYTDTQLTDYSTTTQMTQAISDALVPFETAAQQDAAIAAALAGFYDSTQTDAAITAALVPYSTTVQMNQAIADALVPYGTVAQRDAAIAAALAGFYDSTQTDALRDGGPAGRSHRGGAGVRHAEQRPELERRADLQPAPGQQRPAEPVGGRRIDRHLSKPGRHHPDRVGQLRPQRDLHAGGNGRSDHRSHRRPGPVPTPKRSGGPGTHRHGPGALLGPNGGLDLRGGRAGQLRHQQLGDLGHLLGPFQLRPQLPGRFQDRHGSAGLLHPDRSRSADRQCTGKRGSLELLHAGRDAELRGQRAARVLPSDRAGLPAHGHVHPVHPILDQLANPNGDRRCHRRRGVPDPSAGRPEVLRGQRQRELRVPGAHQRDASHDQGPPAPGAPGGLHHPHGNHARAHLRRLHQGGI